MTNSIRDNVKDAIRETLAQKTALELVDADLVANIADAVFDALEITPEEQDKETINRNG